MNHGSMHVEILVEEASAEAALKLILPRVLGDGVTFRIHPFEGKQDLLRKLPARLRGYANWIDQINGRIVVLVDEDRQDCAELKADLEQVAADAGLRTKSVAGTGEDFTVLNRIAVEELEAWFLGDPVAVHAAYPRVPANYAGRRALRDPDAVAGGTWEALERLLKRAGYHHGGLAKITAAQQIASHMDPTRNRSTSFRHFVAGLEALVAA